MRHVVVAVLLFLAVFVLVMWVHLGPMPLPAFDTCEAWSNGAFVGYNDTLLDMRRFVEDPPFSRILAMTSTISHIGLTSIAHRFACSSDLNILAYHVCHDPKELAHETAVRIFDQVRLRLKPSMLAEQSDVQGFLYAINQQLLRTKQRGVIVVSRIHHCPLFWDEVTRVDLPSELLLVVSGHSRRFSLPLHVRQLEVTPANASKAVDAYVQAKRMCHSFSEGVELCTAKLVDWSDGRLVLVVEAFRYSRSRRVREVNDLIKAEYFDYFYQRLWTQEADDFPLFKSIAQLLLAAPENSLPESVLFRTLGTHVTDRAAMNAFKGHLVITGTGCHRRWQIWHDSLREWLEFFTKASDRSGQPQFFFSATEGNKQLLDTFAYQQTSVFPEYWLQNLPFHLEASGNVVDVCHLRMHLPFLAAKLNFSAQSFLVFLYQHPGLDDDICQSARNLTTFLSIHQGVFLQDEPRVHPQILSRLASLMSAFFLSCSTLACHIAAQSTHDTLSKWGFPAFQTLHTSASPRASLLLQAEDSISHLTVSSQYVLAASASRVFRVSLTDPSDYRVCSLRGDPKKMTALAFSPDGRAAFASYDDPGTFWCVITFFPCKFACKPVQLSILSAATSGECGLMMRSYSLVFGSQTRFVLEVWAVAGDCAAANTTSFFVFSTRVVTATIAPRMNSLLSFVYPECA